MSKMTRSEKLVFGTLVVCGVLTAIVADIRYPGWGRPVLLTAIVFGYNAVANREYWKEVWFWLTFSGCLALHIPAIMFLQSILERYKMVITFAVGLVEGLIVLVIITALSERFSASERESSR